MSEDEQPLPPLLRDPIERIGELLLENRPRTLVALAGLPGSGKTTLAGEISVAVNRRFGEKTMAALGMDGFHLAKIELAAMPDPAAALARRGAPWTFDPSALATALHKLRKAAGNSSVRWPDFQHGAGDPVPNAIEVAAGIRIVLVEGLYLLSNDEDWRPVSKQFNERWFLDTPMKVSLERLTLRHMATRGYGRAEAERRIAVNDRLNAALILPTRQQSDWRVQ